MTHCANKIRALSYLLTKLFCSFYTSFCDFLFLVQDFCHICFSHVLFFVEGCPYIWVFLVSSLLFRIFPAFLFFILFLSLRDFLNRNIQDFPDISFFDTVFLTVDLYNVSLAPCIFFPGPWRCFSEDTFFFLSLFNAFLIVLFALSVHSSFKNCTWK